MRSLAVAPGMSWKLVGVGDGEDVGLLDAAEAVDGRAVELHALLEGRLELDRRDGDDLSWPRTSVNHSRTRRTRRSSIVRST